LGATIAVIYAGSLQGVAAAFGEAAEHVSARVRLRRIVGDEDDASGRTHPQANFEDLVWADGIAFGTPLGPGGPAPELMAYIEATEPLWSMGRLHDKVVTVFTDQPEQFSPDTVLHPIYDALYHWGAVIVGPRAFDLSPDTHPQHRAAGSAGPISEPRLKSAQYRAHRLVRIAGLLAEEHPRRAPVEL
jgi:NAD(P)H dehydrogenase (quinone)